MKKRIKISVRNLVEYSFRSGDLDLTFFTQPSQIEAIRAHQKIQKSRPEEYSSEVFVSYQYVTEDIVVDITGRIDGVFKYPDKTIVEEIKTTKKSPESLESSENRLHWGQLQCYSYIYAKNNNLKQVETQLTYYNLETGEIKEKCRTFSIDELEKIFQSLIRDYIEWAEEVTKWYEYRDESVGELEFPFGEYRKGQQNMVLEIYNTISKSEQLMVQAPTGIGKTMASIFSSVKTIGDGYISKVFYLTARTTGKNAAEKALEILRENGLKIKAVTITAKEKICFNPKTTCNAAECKYANGHFDRLNGAVKDAFQYQSFKREKIEELAEKHTVCPFDFSLELAMWVDYIICDYNYVFDPRVYLRRFFLDENNNYAFLTDEAHNLVDRAREMFSAELQKSAVLELRRKVSKKLEGIYNSLSGINSWMLENKKKCLKNCNSFYEKEQPESLNPLLRKFILNAEKWLVQNVKTTFREDLTDFYFDVHTYLRVSEIYDDSYATIYESFNRDLKVKLFCLDPSVQLKEALKRGKTTIYFSATMTPLEYFKHLLGCDEFINELILASPFPRENLCVLAASSISTYYKDRDVTKYNAANAVFATVSQKKGNYLVFFPSYEYMLKIYDIFTQFYPNIDTIIQTPGMPEVERKLFIERFKQQNDNTFVGFAVMGGVFGEAIDLEGDRLTGAVIIGVGLPALCVERDLIREYFDEHSGSGFEFAYQYPGINKVFQASGRVIRSENDRGIVLLIDKRFSSSRYRSLFPEEWNPVFVRNEDQIQNVLRNFWGS